MYKEEIALFGDIGRIFRMMFLKNYFCWWNVCEFFHEKTYFQKAPSLC